MPKKKAPIGYEYIWKDDGMEIKVKKSPFYLKRIARGSFEVKIKIIFKKNYNRPNLDYIHDLNFHHYVTLTHIEDNKTLKAKKGYEYFFKNHGIHYDDPNDFVV